MLSGHVQNCWTPLTTSLKLLVVTKVATVFFLQIKLLPIYIINYQELLACNPLLCHVTGYWSSVAKLLGSYFHKRIGSF